MQERLTVRTLPAVVIGSTSFFIAGRTLFVTDIMIVTKAITANYFKRT